MTPGDRKGRAVRTAVRAAILAVAALTGCRSAAGPADHFHRIEPAAPCSRNLAPVLAGSLEIEPLRGEAVLSALPLLYRTAGPTSPLARYGYQLWTDPPAVMLQRAIGDYLEATGLAERVVYPEQRVRPDYVLAGRIDRLEHLPDDPSVVIALQLDLAGEGGAVPLYSLHAVERVDAPDRSADAAVQAYGVGLRRILDRLEREIPAELGVAPGRAAPDRAPRQACAGGASGPRPRSSAAASTAP